MRFGSKISGRRVAVPESLGFTKPGEIYEIDIFTERSFVNDVAVASQLMQLEKEIPDLKILCIETFPDSGAITLQIKDMGPGSISLAGLISIIPTLFILLGIAVVGYMTWQTLQTSPWLLWLGLLAGAGVMFYFFVGTKLDKPTSIRKREPKTDVSGRLEKSQKLQRLTRLRVGYENKINREQAKIDGLKSDREKLRKTRKKAADKPSIDKKLKKIASKIETLEDSQEAAEKSLNAVMDAIRAQ